MNRRFVIEAVLVAVYGQLLVPGRPVEFLVPYSTIQELYEMRDSDEPVMPEQDEDAHVKQKIKELIDFFEESFNRKKIERALQMPWKKSPPLLVNDDVTFTIVYAIDNAHYGETFDPVETELILTALYEKAPIVTDQLEFLDKVIEAEVPVQTYDVEDFEFALEEYISAEDWKTL
ncbi:ADP-heptose synthase [Paenibacillus ginsengarvi]|uniref:ADP-heptose synthase n=1 Tax=Paenibacillus ginsengarvi TaxID=400777 RepID=A0A3B0C332_9BACL|nr:ADP-heptose synthase [Paenibacillus ginsengarvi]RKN78988.1 ADP-heptose synthase [Paenibacillus ginsengarvi]